MLINQLFLLALFTVANGFPTTTSHDLISATSLTSIEPASQATASPSTTPIPSIIPDWHGVRVPNYTDLHIQFTIPLQCGSLSLPTGVLGFYSWILTLVMLYCSFVTNARDRSKGRCGMCLSHIVNMIFFYAMFALRTAGALVCKKQNPGVLDRPKHWEQSEGRYVDDGSISDSYRIAWFVMSVMLAAATFHVMISFEHGLKTLILVTLMAVFVPAMFYSSYANFLYIDGAVWRQIITVSIPMLVALVVLLGLALRSNGYERVKKREWSRSRIAWTTVGCILGLGLIFHVWAMGMSFIILGRMIDDPWGGKTMWNNFGQVMLALEGILVPIAVCNALFGGGA